MKIEEVKELSYTLNDEEKNTLHKARELIAKIEEVLKARGCNEVIKRCGDDTIQCTHVKEIYSTLNCILTLETGNFAVNNPDR